MGDVPEEHYYKSVTSHTADLKQQIERILNWGPSKHWRARDFADLSQRIRAHTGEHTDAHELQAFWKSSAGAPSTLLDTLARFADYDDWDDFCTRNFYGVVETDDETVLTHTPMWEIPTRWVLVICWLSVLASVIVGVLLVWKRP